MFTVEQAAAMGIVFPTGVPYDDEDDEDDPEKAARKKRFGGWTCPDCDVRGVWSVDQVCWFCGKEPPE